jgi:hypothetical protein
MDIQVNNDVYMSEIGFSEYEDQASLREHGVVTRVNGQIYHVTWDNGHRNTYQRRDLLSRKQMFGTDSKFTIVL